MPALRTVSSPTIAPSSAPRGRWAWTARSILLAFVAAAPTMGQNTAVRFPGATPGAIPGSRVEARSEFALSSLTPLWSQGGLGPVEVDTAVGGEAAGDGTPMVIQGQAFAHGLGTASTSAIAYDLLGRGVYLSTWVGIDDTAGAGGSAVFQIFGDGALLFESGIRTGADPALFTGVLPLRGVRELLLVIADAGDGTTDDLANWAEPKIVAFGMPSGNGKRSRSTRGRWQTPTPWPIDPIHAMVLGDGRLLTFASAAGDGPGDPSTSAPHGSTRADLWDPSTNTHLTVDHPTTEVFGAGLARIRGGTPITLGGFAGRDGAGAALGTTRVNRFQLGSEQWTPDAPMEQPRFGVTGLTLGGGDVVALGGTNSTGNVFVPERFDGKQWQSMRSVTYPALLSVGDAAIDHTYPFAHLAPDGRILWLGWDETMGIIDPRGNGRWDLQTQREPIQRAWGAAASAASDRVLITGGVDHRGAPGGATRSAITVDVSSGSPVVQATGAMLFGRADHSATLLADGRVLITGGSPRHLDGATPSAIRVAEIWDPTSGRFTVASPSTHARGYRSTSVLLPDGRVWTGGGECGPGCNDQLTAETFQPPYLFNPNGSLAIRPAIQLAPADVAYRSTFAVQMTTGAPIDRVTLLRAGSDTHGTNTDQRFLELSFSQSGSSLMVDAPGSGNLAPPGDYLLFAINDAGVPSVASLVRIDEPDASQWAILPSSDGSVPTCRHEAAMVTVGGKLYLMGGRGPRQVEEFDPVTREWRGLGNPPLELHHFQPVVVGGIVHVVGAFTGNYPNEISVPNVYLWNPITNVWSVGPSIPAARRRGSAGTFVRDGLIYVVGGNNLGHNGGAQPWFDVYDPIAQTWSTLPDAPRARDHFLAVPVGNRLVLAGGRTTDLPNPFDGTIPQVDVYDFALGVWSTLGQTIPTERAGTMAVGVGQHVLVVGGESDSMLGAHPETEALNVLTDRWTTLPDLNVGRHSGGVGAVGDRVYVVSGAGNRGGTPELDSVELLDAGAALEAASNNLLTNGAFDAGFASWQRTGSTELRRESGVAAPGVMPPSARIAAGSLSQVVPGLPGRSYTARAFFQAFNGGTSSLLIEALDGGGAVLASLSRPMGPVALGARVGGTLVAPGGTVSMRVTVTAGSNRIVVVDDLILIED